MSEPRQEQELLPVFRVLYHVDFPQLHGLRAPGCSFPVGVHFVYGAIQHSQFPRADINAGMCFRIGSRTKGFFDAAAEAVFCWWLSAVAACAISRWRIIIATSSAVLGLHGPSVHRPNRPIGCAHASTVC